MNHLIVIGLTGVARSGKDTVARILAHRLGFFRVALADGVRSALRDLDGATWEFSKELEKAGKGMRWALQRLGGDAREKVAAAVGDAGDRDPCCNDREVAGANRSWCYLAMAKIAYAHAIHPSPRHRFVIPDVSYPHEIEAVGDAVRALGGHYQTWRIHRPGAGLEGAAAAHQSEIGRATLPADLVLANRGDLAELEYEVIHNSAYVFAHDGVTACPGFP